MSSHSTQQEEIVDSMLELVFSPPEDIRELCGCKTKSAYTFEDSVTKKPELDYGSLLSSLQIENRCSNTISIKRSPPMEEELAESIGVMKEMFLARQQTFESDENFRDKFIRPKTNCSILLQYNLFHMPDETRESIRFLVQNNLIDYLTMTPEAVEQDLIRCFGETMALVDERGSDNSEHTDLELVGDFLVSRGVFCKYVAWVMLILSMAYEDQEVLPPRSKVIERLGLEIDNENSICYWAAKNKIPIFCTEAYEKDLLERIFDCHTGRFKGFSFNSEADSVRMKEFLDDTGHSKRGIIVLGETGQYRPEGQVLKDLSWNHRDPVWLCIDYAIVILQLSSRRFDFLDNKLLILPDSKWSPRLTISSSESIHLFPIMVLRASSKIGLPHFSLGPLQTISCLARLLSSGLSKAIRIVDEALERRKLPAKNDAKNDELIGPGKGCAIVLEYGNGGFIDGHRESIRFLVKHRLVDCLVMDKDCVFQDLARCFGKVCMVGSYPYDSASIILGEFRKEKRERPCYDASNDHGQSSYDKLFQWLLSIKSRIIEEQESGDTGTLLSCQTCRIIECLGLEIKNESSICFWAAKNKIPIYSGEFVSCLNDTLELYGEFRDRGRDCVKEQLGLIAKEGSERLFISATSHLEKYYLRLPTEDTSSSRVFFTDYNDIPLKPHFYQVTNVARVIGNESITFPLLISQTFFKYAKSSE